MRFDLDNILLDQILFYMENQEGDFFLDTHERHIIDILNNDCMNKLNFNDHERFTSIPRWLPNDGYRLMEKFAATLKNPVVRHELAEALNRNRGVFRAFRNVLDHYPEVEKIWFSYKEKEMKKAILLWYNALREEWGLEPVGEEPEDTSSLVLEDFFIKCDETESADGFTIIFTAQTSKGDDAASIKASKKNEILNIDCLDVKQEYRGLGLGKILLSKIIEKADMQKIDVTLELPFEFDYFSRSLYLENFKPVFQKFKRIFH